MADEQSRHSSPDRIADVKCPSLQTIAILVLLCVATCRSLTDAADAGDFNYWEAVETERAELEEEVTRSGGINVCLSSKPDLLRHLANVRWLNGDTFESAKIYSALWTAEANVNPSEYNLQFVKDALRLAAVYQAQGAFKHASECYESILGYEINRLEQNNPKVVRDANNLAVAYYLESGVQTDKRERERLLERSRQMYLLAGSLADDKTPSLVATIRTNRNFLKRDYAGPKRPK